MNSQFLFALIVIFVLNSITDGSLILFERDFNFDDRKCTAQLNPGVGSISHCSAACAKETFCVGFFFKSSTMECHWTSEAHTDPNACPSCADTLYYSKYNHSNCYSCIMGEKLIILLFKCVVRK